jgi:hypothetical protein
MVSHKKLNLDTIMGHLKDFQRATVDYAFQRLYLDEDPTDRFLVADEVGLGKTLVARGIIAKTVDHLWDRDERIDVIYVCSNADIARQNTNRLNIMSGEGFCGTTRITLLPLELKNIRDKRFNFVSFTPGTAFDLASRAGWMYERALLFRLLADHWEFHNTRGINVLRVDASAESFRRVVDSYMTKESTPDFTLAERFYCALDQNTALGDTSLRTRFDKLCEVFVRSNSVVADDHKKEQRCLVGNLRELLAETCLDALEPDLIILDEFQRFKSLLDATTDEGKLASKLFRYPKAKTILLSATPYKMYTVEDEAEGDDHYQDFCQTLDFLFHEPESAPDYRELLQAYRRELQILDPHNPGPLRELGGKIEESLKQVMVRTERLAVTPDRSGMLQEFVGTSSQLTPGELDSFIGLQQVSELLENGSAVEYWKSAPYLFNFMEDGYKLKSDFKEFQASPDFGSQIRKTLLQHSDELLTWDDVKAYKRVDPGNVRLRDLFTQTVDDEAWRLLWLPPALPYYQLGGPFEGEAAKRAKKRLLFSSWRVVPKVVATLLSYEAERRMFSLGGAPPENTPEARKKLRPLLVFRQSEGRLAGMPVFGLLYPSVKLASAVDPITQLSRSGPISVKDILVHTSHIVTDLLSPILTARAKPTQTIDEAWYWAAPLLLDYATEPTATIDFLDKLLNADLSDEEEPPQAKSMDENDETPQIWLAHVQQAKRLLLEQSEPLGRPPDDLPLVLSLLALGGPSVTALRAFGRLAPAPALSSLRPQAMRTAHSFRRLFNLPEVTALVRGMNAAEPFWRRVLEYCVNGCLQSVLDEYVHVLTDFVGLIDLKAENLDNGIGEIAEKIESSLSIRTASVAVDNVRPHPSEDRMDVDAQRMRLRFALRFGEDQSEDLKRVNRSGQVRDAFNSPFWPFVLASTSVGQEGLDFHLYCHAVMHWNLPSNPVDLEQREGRVHRYKGHAIRKNVAAAYGGTDLSSQCDPWSAMFRRAVLDRPADSSDLVPYWVYQIPNGAKIERHLPFLPMSQERQRMELLRRSLVLYRMVFGQPRQQELVKILAERYSPEEVNAIASMLRIDLSPPIRTENYTVPT